MVHRSILLLGLYACSLVLLFDALTPNANGIVCFGIGPHRLCWF